MGYWPDGTNTGVPDGVVLDVRTGDIHVTKAGTVLSNLAIRGTVHIEADNVTITNCSISSSGYWVVYIHQGVTGAVIQNSTLDGLGNAGKGILGQGTFLQNDISNVVDGIDVAGDNTRIEGNYIHNLYGTDGPHYDGINIDASNVTVKHNTVVNDHGQTSALMVSSDWGTDKNVLVEDNLLVGGGYTIYAVTGDAGPGTLVDVRFVNNHIGSGAYGATNFNTNISITGTVNDGMKLAADLSDGPYAPGPAVPTGPTVPNLPPVTPPSDGNATAGADNLHGTSGNDTINGRGGNDILDGGAGYDVLTGGAGNDTFVFASAVEIGSRSGARDTITDFIQGQDKIDLSSIDANTRVAGNQDFTLLADNDAAFTKTSGELAWHTDAANGRTIIQADTNGDGIHDFEIELKGLVNLKTSDLIGAGSVTTAPPPAVPDAPTGPNVVRLLGTAGSDQIAGDARDNYIDGKAGNDTLVGGGGQDTIVGGAGQDFMTGGTGNDTFVFQSVSDMGATSATRDVIQDFVRGQDAIDLSALDANARLVGDQAFMFLGANDQAFSRTAGEVAWHIEAAQNRTIVQGDTNGDGVHDFELQLAGQIQLTQGDFVL